LRSVMSPRRFAGGLVLALAAPLASACGGDAVLPAAVPAAPAAPQPAAPQPAALPPPAPATSGAPAPSDGKPDLAVVHRIKDEAYRRGQVMDHLFWLTDVNGPRLTASPGFKSAADWVVRTLASWGAANAHLEPWGHFGRAWSVQRFELALVEPGYARLEGAPKAWSRGTSGAVVGALAAAPLFPDHEDRDDALDLAKLAARIHAYTLAQKGKLHGRFVLLDPPRDLALPKDVDPLRYDDKKLGELSLAPDHAPPETWTWPLQRLPRDGKKRAALVANLPMEVIFEFGTRRRHVYDELWRFFADEGVLGVLSTDDRGEGAVVFAESTGEWEASQPWPPPVVAMAPEDYDRLARLVAKNVPARARLDVAVASSERDEEAYNVVAEIPGGAKRDELVMMGAHLDSWHAGTGATDNGAGSAVMLEAFRILEALRLPLARTVRLALWSGEEQGLFGSRGYVKQHFADPVTMALRPEHAKLSAYFNLDNGTGRIRGVYLQGNDMARPVFEGWLAPFKDEGAGTVTLRNTGGTDHLSFDAVGLPGFEFIQDPLDYMSRTHHSSLDVYEHAQAGDLMQAAAIVASVVYDAANRAEPMPRVPLPPALPPRAP
jgi:carboxypeptidase Q